MSNPITDKGNFSVRACAGSGKTYTLVNRFRRRFESAPGSLLAITFTDLAAGEMKERISQDILALRNHELARGNRKAAEMYRKLLFQLPKASISTFHSFCSRLVSEHSTLLGVSQGFELLDALEANRLRFNAVIRAIEICIDSKEEDNHAFKAINLLLNSISHHELLSIVKRAVTSPNWIKSFSQLVSKSYFEQGAPLPAAIAKVTELLEQNSLPTEGASLYEMAELLLTKAEKPRTLSSIRKKLSGTPHANLNDSKLIEIALGYAELLSYCRVKKVERFENQLLIGLAELLRIARDQFEQLKGDQLDFDDLIFHAHRLLCSGEQQFETVVEQIKGRYTHVFVDEFQDTDETQWDIVRELSSDDSGFLPDKLFIVGDDQQAIYGFRGADVTTFRRAREELSGTQSSLVTNRRCAESIIEFCNRVFPEMFGNSVLNPQGVEYLSMQKFRKERGEVRFTFPFDSADEPQVVAGIVKDLSEDNADPDFDFSDIAILARKHRNLASVVPHLSALNIPYSIRMTATFFGKSEVLDVVALLGSLIDPNDELSLAHFLRSPLCGLSDPTLLYLKTMRAENLLLAVLEFDRFESVSAHDATCLKKAAVVFSMFPAMLVQFPFAEVFSKLLDFCGTSLAYSSFPDASIVAESHKFMLWLSRKYTREGKGIVEFCEFLRIGGELSSGGSVKQKGRVNLLTIFASKGLEFKNVILMGCSDRLSNKVDTKPATLWLEEQSRTVQVPVFSASAEAAGQFLGIPEESFAKSSLAMGPWSYLARVFEEEKNRSESLRLLYVSATRAKDTLIFSAYQKHGKLEFDKSSFMGMLCLNGDEIRSGDEVSSWLADCAVSSVRYDKQGFLQTYRRDFIESALSGVKSSNEIVKLSQEKLADRSVESIGVTALSAFLGEMVCDPSIQPGWITHRITGNPIDFGTALHKCLENYPTPPQDVLNALAGIEQFSKLKKEEVVSHYNKILEVAQVSRALSAAEKQFEWPFILNLSNLKIRGKLDLLACCDDRWVVIDYKSGRIPTPGMKEYHSYRFQLAIYRRAVMEVFSSAIVDACLVFSANGCVIEAATDEELESAVQRWRAQRDAAPKF